ncbi:MAG: AfsR/SARP family transcriptional regulator, partial [Betaproteobacteria bacterium]
RRLIERNGLVAPLDASAAWPFRLRIRALGGFVIVRDGEPLRFTGKAQQRPLDLLKLLVVSGGADVDVEELATQLWPDADGDAARVSFGTTLFRLRKLLDAGDVLVVSGGKLSLAPQLAWTDVRALEVAIESAEDAGSADAPARDVARAAQRLLDASPGPLLGSEEAPWIARPRDALRARFVRSLMRLGEELERRREWRLAVDVYRRGLEADNLSESFYRGLMRALAASGDPSEALVAFRRCRELLSIVLGVKPSSETERLYREIASGGTPALVR